MVVVSDNKIRLFDSGAFVWAPFNTVAIKFAFSAFYFMSLRFNTRQSPTSVANFKTKAVNRALIAIRFLCLDMVLSLTTEPVELFRNNTFSVLNRYLQQIKD